MIIDFHTHTFPDAIAERVLHKLAKASGTAPATDGTLSGLAASMKEAGITWSVNLPVMTGAEQVVSVNSNMLQRQEAMKADGILTFGGMHPDFEDYRTELKRLADAGIKGVKLHPAYQNVDLDDIRMMRIIACASELGLVTIIHAGIDIGIYDHNYSSTAQVLTVLKDVQPEKFVLAHMGGWACWHEVESDLAGAPLWMDTAFTIGPLDPNPDAEPGPYSRITLADEDFLRLARKHGTDRILFATDSPWQPQKRYAERFKTLGLTAEEQERILYRNAAELLNLGL